jgi:hypothetical protein
MRISFRSFPIVPILTFALGVAIAVSASVNAAIWNGPSATPPNNNITLSLLGQWTSSGSDVYYGSGNVGIGGAPSGRLDVIPQTGRSDNAANIRTYGNVANTWCANGLTFGDDATYGGGRYFMCTRGTNESVNANWRMFYYNHGSGSDAWISAISIYPSALNGTSLSMGFINDAVRFDATGNITAAGYFHSSDLRLKERVQTFPDALWLVKKLRGVTFDWKKDGSPSAGVIAQEVEAVLPSAVKTDPATGLKSVEYDQLIAPLIEAVKEQQTQINAQQQKIDALTYEIDQLKAHR